MGSTKAWRLALSGAIVSLSLLAPTVTRAAPAEPIVLEYVAPAGCPRQSDFEREISARTSAARFVEGNAARTFRVRIERDGDEFSGSLDVTSPTDPPAHRDIRGEQCESVALVLAIAAALAIDPEADANPTARVASSETPETQASPVQPTPSPPAPFPLPVLPPPIPAPLPVAAPPSPSSAFDVGVSFSATAGPAPKMLIAPAPFVEFEDLEPSIWAPLVRLQAIVAKTGVIGPAVEEARFIWYSARVAGCPVRPLLASDLALRPCAVIDAGAIHAEGSKIAIPRARTRAWVTFGLEARLRWDFADPLFVDTALGLKLAPVRYVYVFEHPDQRIYQPPWLSPAGEVGFGARFF